MTIKMRILIPMIVFTIVASSIVLISDIVKFSQYVEEDISHRLNMAALAALSEIDSLKAQSNAASLYLAKDPNITSALINKNYETLFSRAEQLNDNTGVNFCIITDASGSIRVCTHNQELNGLDGAKLLSISEALRGRNSTTIEPGLSVSLAISAAAPIYDDKGEMLGVVMAGFPLDDEGFVDSIKSLTDCEVSVCRQDVRIATTITLEDGTRAVGTKTPSDISRMVLEGNIYSGKVRIMSDELISRYHPLMGVDGNIVGMLFVGHYTNEATDTIEAFVQIGLVFMLLLIAVFVVIISYISEHIVLPINEAAGVLSEISKGNFDARVLGDYKGDLALIKKSVNNTAQELSLYLKEKIYAEQIAHESELAKARAVEASIVKSEFLASMSHEIRTPMNAIIGMSEILSAEPLNEQQRECVRDIRIASTALLSIINDILDTSKIEAGKLTLTPVHFEVEPFISNIASVTSFTAENKGIEFILSVGEALPEYLYGDDVRLRQILLNLLGNAVKFTESGSVCLDVKYSGGIACFTVTDTGMGIKESDIERLFDPFEQLDSVKNHHKQGTGLGLPITKSLVEMMQGEILVSSVYGESTTFTVKLPLPPGDKLQAVNAADTVEDVSAKEAAILLVDDNEANRNVGRGLLRMNGIECDAASDGEEAVRMVQLKDYDIVFMDHMMPNMDGVEATSIIRAMGGKYERLVIIALSANAMPEARKMFLDSGMDDFLAKPIERALLVQTLIKWLPPEKVRIGEKAAGAEQRQDDDPAISKLREVDDIDVDEGLKLTGGSGHIYMNALKAVTKRLPESIAMMTNFLENGELDRLAIDIHGMKSSLGTAGARTLSMLAYEMEVEAAAGNADFCNTRFPEFSAQVLSLHKRLSEIAFDEPRRQPREGDSTILRPQLGEIRRCLEEFDDESALDILAYMREYDFGGKVNELLKELDRQIEIFEYEEAADTINNLETFL